MRSIELFCLGFSFIAMVFDIKWERVPNYWNLCGLLTLFIWHGFEINRVVGCFSPLLLLFPFFLCKMIGTGDIKVFMVLGYSLGLERIIQCMVYSFLIGACISLPILLYRCDLRQRFIYFFTYLKTVFETGTFPPYLASGKHPENTHFTIFIFCSVVLLIMQGGC